MIIPYNSINDIQNLVYPFTVQTKNYIQIAPSQTLSEYSFNDSIILNMKIIENQARI